MDIINPLYVLKTEIHDHHNHLKWVNKNPTLFNTEILFNILNVKVSNSMNFSLILQIKYLEIILDTSVSYPLERFYHQILLTLFPKYFSNPSVALRILLISP